MKPIMFREQNTVFAKNQPQYNPLPAHNGTDGRVTSCWRLSIVERLKVLFQGSIFVQVLTFNSPLQPINITVENPVKTVTSDDLLKDCASMGVVGKVE